MFLLDESGCLEWRECRKMGGHCGGKKQGAPK